jgi:uncharacterized protein involved in exopolysaccharide biosynthesis
MFNLNDELMQWRRSMSAAGLESPEVIGELESHLRDDIEQQIRSGCSASDAFRISVERLGGPRALRNEFDLVRPAGVRAMLRRHWWKIALCSVVGVIAAGVVHALRPAMYISEARILIRAIIADAPSGLRLEQRVGIPEEHVLNPLMRDEVEILSSRDLASEVVARIGPERILRKAGGGGDSATALILLRSGLRVQQVAPGSAVIHLTFRHPDSAIVQPVLREVIEHYLKMHVATHRARASGDPFFAIEVGRISNISQLQAPSQPFFDSAGAYRPLAMMVMAGAGAGLVWVLVAVWLSHLDRRQRSIG